MYEGLRNLEVPGQRKRRRARRVVKVGLIGLLAVAILLLGTGGFVYLKVKEKIEKNQKNIQNVEPVVPNGPRNVLIVGSDRRDVIGGDEREERQFRGGSGQRTDTMMLLHLSAKAEKAVMLSLPRDLWVEIPGRGTNKLNAAYAFGGHELLLETVRRFTGIRINNYVEVNFAGFRSIVDAIGGVDIFVNRPLRDEKAGLNIPRRGCIHMDGLTSLAYVRARSIDPTADLGRIQRQQAFMRILLRKARSLEVVLNPIKLLGLADAVGKNVTYDQGVDLEVAREVAGALSKLSSDDSRVDFRIVPGSGARRRGQSVILPKEPQAARLFAAIAADKPLPPYGKTSQSIPEPRDVRVRVLNGSGVTGLASKVAARLRKTGFRVGGTGNADAAVQQTEIRYAPGANLKAALLEKQFPGAITKPGGSGQTTDVIVVLGPDADVTPTASATPTPTKKPRSAASSCG